MMDRNAMLHGALACAILALGLGGGSTTWSHTIHAAFATAAPIRRSTTMTMKHDLANRSPDIHWPEGFDPSHADLFSHNAVHIDASCERVWSHIIDAAKWPSWYPNSKDVTMLSGGDKLAQGAVFRWSTFGLPLESKVNEFAPYSRVGWYGYAPGSEPTF